MAFDTCKTSIVGGIGMAKVKTFKLRMRTFFTIARFIDAVTRYEVIELRKHGYRPRRLRTLNVLLQHGGQMSPTALSRFTFQTRHAVSSMCNALEREGLVRRERSKGDRRSVIISLTDEGVQYLSKIRPIAQNMSQDILSCLDDEQVETFNSLLRRVRDHLEEQIGDYKTW